MDAHRTTGLAFEWLKKAATLTDNLPYYLLAHLRSDHVLPFASTNVIVINLASDSEFGLKGNFFELDFIFRIHCKRIHFMNLPILISTCFTVSQGSTLIMMLK